MATVVVLGSMGFDLTVSLPRLPRAGETLLGGRFSNGPGGKGANSAVAAARAGGAVILISAAGNDEFGRLALANAASNGIDVSHVRKDADRPNQVALIFVGGDGANMIGVAEGASAAFTPAEIDRLPNSVFEHASAFLANLELPAAAIHRGLLRARGAGVPTILNPAPANPAILEAGWLESVDILTPNQEEARLLTGVSCTDLAATERAARLLLAAGSRTVIVTLGEAGCLIVSDGETAHVHAPRVDVVDTVGAGDAFNGVLAVALAEGKPLREAARWACAAGSLAVTGSGAQGSLPSRSEIEAMLAR